MDTASAVLQCVILEMKKKKWKVNKHFFTDKQLQSSNETAETGGKCKWRRSCCSVICGGWDGEMILWIFRSWYDSVQLIPLKLSVHTHKHTCAHTHTHTQKRLEVLTQCSLFLRRLHSFTYCQSLRLLQEDKNSDMSAAQPQQQRLLLKEQRRCWVNRIHRRKIKSFIMLLVFVLWVCWF